MSKVKVEGKPEHSLTLHATFYIGSNIKPFKVFKKFEMSAIQLATNSQCRVAEWLLS